MKLLKNRVFLILLAFVLLAGFLRVFDLASKSFWADELFSIWHAQEILNLQTFLSPHQPNDHPPLYFLLLKGWGLFGGGEFYLRLLSVFFSLGTVVAVFFLARQFFNKRVALLASFFVSYSPLLLLYDREVRMYPLFVLLAVLSLLFMLKALKENKTIFWLLYSLVNILAVYTHYYAFLLIAGQGLFFILMWPKYGQYWGTFLLTLLVTGLAFTLWLPSFLYHLGHGLGAGNFVRFPVDKGLIVKPLYLYFSFNLGQTILPWDFKLVIPGLIVFTIFFLLALKVIAKNRELGAFFLSTLFFPVFLALCFSELMLRYMLFVVPLYYFLLAVGFEQIKKMFWQILCLSVIVFIWGCGLANYYSNRDFHILATVDPWREVGKYLNKNVQTKDFVINVGGVPVRYYFKGNCLEILRDDTLANIKEEIKSNQPERIWLILSNPQFDQVGKESLAWLNSNYQLLLERKDYHDPDFAKKATLMKKVFLEYRVKIYLFKTQGGAVF